MPLIAKKLTKNTSVFLYAVLAELLVVGFLGYSLAPILSVLSLAGGFLLALFVAFGGIMKENKKDL